MYLNQMSDPGPLGPLDLFDLRSNVPVNIYNQSQAHSLARALVARRRHISTNILCAGPFFNAGPLGLHDNHYVRPSVCG